MTDDALRDGIHLGGTGREHYNTVFLLELQHRENKSTTDTIRNLTITITIMTAVNLLLFAYQVLCR